MSPAIGFHSTFTLIWLSENIQHACTLPENQCQSWQSDLDTTQSFWSSISFHPFTSFSSSLHASFSCAGPPKWTAVSYFSLCNFHYIHHHCIVINNYNMVTSAPATSTFMSQTQQKHTLNHLPIKNPNTDTNWHYSPLPHSCLDVSTIFIEWFPRFLWELTSF